MTVITCGTCGDKIKRLKFGNAQLAGVCKVGKIELERELAHAREQLGLWMRNAP